MADGGWACRRLVGFDLETTGLDVERDEPISFAFVEFVGGSCVAVDAGYALPDRAISRGATAVHGLRRNRLIALGAAPVEVVARRIALRLRQLGEQGTPVVGCNLAYDLTIVDRVLSRCARGASLRTTGWRGPALDVLVLDRAMDGDFERRPARRLDALCEHYGVAPPTHTATGDAEAAVRVLLAQVAAYPALATCNLDELQARQVAWHAAWCSERWEQRAADGPTTLFAELEPWPYAERAAAR